MMRLKLSEGEEGPQGGVSGWGCAVTPLKGRAVLQLSSSGLVDLVAKVMETSLVPEAKRGRKIKSPQWEAEKAKNKAHKELLCAAAKITFCCLLITMARSWGKV